MSIESIRILALLQASLCNSTIELDNFVGIDSAEWNSLFQLSIKQDVVALVTDGIRQLPPQLQLPREVSLQFLAEQEKVRLAYVQKQHALVELVRFFNHYSIDTMIIKGIETASCYPVPAHRQFIDVDIYQMGDYQKADELISQELGISIHNDAHHHTKYRFKGVTVENHYDFLNCHDYRSNIEYEKLLKQEVAKGQRQVEFGGEKLLLPSPTFNALFLMRHMASHFAAGQITVRYLCDWLMFLQKQGTMVDWAMVTQVYQQFNMHEFVSSIQAILEDYFALQPIKELPRSNNYILQHRILNDIMYGEFPQPEHRKENLGRLFWKIRRFHANRWKREITYSDPQSVIFFRSLFSHLEKPRSIIHKM